MKAEIGSTKSRRRSANRSIRQAVLLEGGYKCANPNCRHILTLELHHIVWIKEGGGNDPSNLVALCPNCHSLHTAGHIPQEAIYAWKSLLMSLNNPNRAIVDLLLVLYDEDQRLSESTPGEAPPPFRFTGDGLGMLSGLLTAGLIEISERYLGANYFGGGMPSFEVRLTLPGRRLVEAWRKGLPNDIQSALEYKTGAV